MGCGGCAKARAVMLAKMKEQARIKQEKIDQIKKSSFIQVPIPPFPKPITPAPVLKSPRQLRAEARARRIAKRSARIAARIATKKH